MNDECAIEREMLYAAYNDISIIDNENNETVIKINDISACSIRLVLPVQYPKKPIKISLETTILTRKDQLTLLNTLKEKLIDRSREEVVCCFEIIQDIHDFIEDNRDKVVIKNDDKVDKDDDQRLSRCFIYFHHIKSENKKKNIVDYASELKLGGLWKEGFPGIILVEGIHSEILEYISRLKRLRWQQMTVKGIWFDNNNNRKFESFTELSDLSTISQVCNDKDLADIYRSSMNLPLI
jgi:hypothetical protein